MKKMSIIMFSNAEIREAFSVMSDMLKYGEQDFFNNKIMSEDDFRKKLRQCYSICQKMLGNSTAKHIEIKYI